MIQKLRDALRRSQDQEAATAVEYGIMVALIAVVIILAVAFIGRELNSSFECVGSTLENNSFDCENP